LHPQPLEAHPVIYKVQSYSLAKYCFFSYHHSTHTKE